MLDSLRFMSCRFVWMVALAAWLLLVGCSQSTTVNKPDDEAASAPAIDEASLRKMLDEVIGFTQTRYMAAERNNAWQIVHGVLAYGHDLQIQAGGKLVPALDFLLKGGEINGWTMRPGDHGLEAVLEAGTKSGQGHEDQWIGYLSQCGLAPDDPIVVRGQTFKIQDLLTQAQWDIYPGMEATWTLMALSTYLPRDATWTSKDGSDWNVERIVDMETKQDLSGSACGGSHRMYGLTMAVNNRLAEGGELTGAWLAADNKIKDVVAKARLYQQPDGNFSTSFFQRAASSPDIATQLHATGHTFEFLTMAMTDDELRQPWVTKAAVQLCQLLEATRDMELECGALYHAAHGLIVYRQRWFGTLLPWQTGATASNTTPAAAPADEKAATAQSPTSREEPRSR